MNKMMIQIQISISSNT